MCAGCRLFGVRCSRCLQLIPSHELVMRAVTQIYHVRCFQCVVCGRQLNKGDQFVLSADCLVYCRLHYEPPQPPARTCPPAFLPLSPGSAPADWFNVSSKCKNKAAHFYLHAGVACSSAQNVQF